MSAATLLVADEHALFRAALAAAVDDHDRLAAVDEAADGVTAVERARARKPDVVLLSARLDGVDGFGACAAIKDLEPDPKVVMVSDTADEHVLLAAVEAGADGYVTKDMPLDALVAALERVHDGEAYVPPGMLGTLLRRLIDRNREAERVYELFMRLTTREQEVLALLVDGCDHDAVADILVISPQTARTHIQNVIRKLGVHSRVEAAALAIRHDLVKRLPAGGR